MHNSLQYSNIMLTLLVLLILTREVQADKIMTSGAYIYVLQC